MSAENNHNHDDHNIDDQQKSWWWNSEQPESGGVAPMDPVAVTRPPKKVNLASPVTFSPLL